MKPDSLFGVWPYVAMSLLTVGIVVRYGFARRRIEAIASRELKNNDSLRGSRMLQLSVTLLLFGHAGALFFPKEMLLWDSTPLRLYLLESIAFVIGVIAFVSWAVLAWRHLERPTDSFASEITDTILLALLFVVLISGLLTAVLYRWGSSWAASILAPYVLTLFRGRPVFSFLAELPFLVRLHVFSSFALLAILPFTRLGLAVILIFRRFFNLIGNPVRAAVQITEEWIRKHNLGSRIWPEED